MNTPHNYMTPQGSVEVRIVLPENVHFEDLHLQLDAGGEVKMDCAPLREICKASGIDPEYFCEEGSEMKVAFLVQGWYRFHLAHGGQPDPALETLHLFADAPEQYAPHFVFQIGHA